MDNTLNLTIPNELIPTKEEAEVAQAFVSLMNDANEDGKWKNEEQIAPIFNLNDGAIFLVGAPMDKVPQKALLLGTCFSSEADNEILSYLATRNKKIIVKTTASDIMLLWSKSSEEDRNKLRAGYFVFSSLPPRADTALFEKVKEFWLQHENFKAVDERVMGDLFFQEQILRRVGARIPDTAWVSTADFFSASENGNLTRTIAERLQSAGIEETDRVFMRLWRGSLKDKSTDDVTENMFFRALSNLPEFLLASAMGKLRAATAGYLTNKQVAETPESKLAVETCKEEMLAVQQFAKKFEKEIKQFSGVLEEMVGDVEKMSHTRTAGAWVFQAEPEILAKKVSDSATLAIASGTISSSGFAFRKFIDVSSIRSSNGSQYSVPFSRDYRGIVYGGELVGITTWTPYNAIMPELRSGAFDISDYFLSQDALAEVQRVAREFSSVTGQSSFTLDFLIPADGMPVFHEMNRLEFSHMSHSSTRILVAYLRYCDIIGTEPSKEEFTSFLFLFSRSKENFLKVFYGRMFDFFGKVVVQHKELQELFNTHKKNAECEYEILRDYPPIWSKF